MKKDRMKTEYRKPASKASTKVFVVLLALLIWAAFSIPETLGAGVAFASDDTPTVSSDMSVTAEPNALKINWAKGSGRTTYTIKCRGGSVNRVSHHKDSRGHCVFDGLEANTSYQISVTPIIGSVRGNPVEFDAKTIPKYSALPHSSVGTSGLSSITIKIGSTNSSSTTAHPDKCYVRVATNSKMSGARMITINPNARNYTIGGLSSQTVYYFEFGSYYTVSGGKVYSQLTKSYIGKTKVKSLSKGSPNCKSIISSLSSSKVSPGSTIAVNLPFVVATTKEKFFCDVFALEAIYQPYFQRAGSNIEVGFYDDLNIVAFKRTKSYAQASARGKKADKKINAIVKKARKIKSKKKQVIYVNNAIGKACNYDKTYKRADNWNPYGCLVRKKAVCLGYSETFYACMHKLGIPCKFQLNKSGSHIWNKVKVNGKWTHIDVTWNDCVGKNKYIWMSDKKTNKIDSHRFK